MPYNNNNYYYRGHPSNYAHVDEEEYRPPPRAVMPTLAVTEDGDKAKDDEDKAIKPLMSIPSHIPVLSSTPLPTRRSVFFAYFPRKLRKKLFYSGSSYEVGRRYTGCVVEWRGSFGFLNCVLIPERVFLHSSDLNGSGFPQFLPANPTDVSVNFELGIDKEKGKFRATKAIAYI